MSDLLNLPRAGQYACILADPPWHFQSWASGRKNGDPVPTFTPSRAPDYETMREPDIAALPVADIAAPNCVLFLWSCWPVLEQSLRVLKAWGFTYKTCAFSWMKGDPYRLFADDKTPTMGLGYWTRANTEPCLLATRGKPKRISAGVRQGILEKAREHSRKPDCVHDRIEQLVAGPRAELFARQRRPGWDCWGNETDKFAKVEAAYAITPPTPVPVRSGEQRSGTDSRTVQGPTAAVGDGG